MNHSKFKIKVETNNKSCVKKIIFSTILVIIGCVIITTPPEKSPLKILGIISAILGGINLIIICLKNIQLTYMENKLQKELLKEMDILNDNTIEEEKTFDLGNAKIKYKKQITIKKQKNTTNTFVDQELNDLGDVRKIIICPNCGSKNVLKRKNSRCQHCDAYIE